jgi:hypothetical protein
MMFLAQSHARAAAISEELNLAEPRLSFILATDNFTTIRPVIERLRRQTARDQIEIVLVAPSASAVNTVTAHRDEFAAIRIIHDPMDNLGPARAAGIRAASAKFVFVGETHSYPHPRLAEAILQYHSGPWSVIIPAFGNANPKGALSWAGFLCDYGGWVEGIPPGQISHIPLYNAAFLRQALLALGDRLAPALSHGDELYVALRDAGHKAYFEPAARLDHVNVASFWHWVKERYAAGIMIANSRALRWPVYRRVLYVLASPLIPIALCSRVVPGVWSTVRKKEVPRSTLFWIVIGMIVKSAGELAGYAGASVGPWECQMHEYEVHKLAYAGSGRAGTT